MGRPQQSFLKLVKVVCLIVVLLSLVITSCSAPPGPSLSPARQPEKKLSLLEEKGTPIDIFLCVDQSDSMNGWDSVPATDPKGIRIDASKYFVNNLAQRSEAKPYLRIGLIEFGTEAHLLAHLTEVTSAADDQGRKNLVGQLLQKSLGYTNFIDTMKVSQEYFGQEGTYTNSRKPIIVIFTDGEPDDPRDLSTDAYFNEITEFYTQNLKDKNCELFVIGVDTVGAAWGRTKPYWEKLVPEDHIFYLRSMEELNYTFNQVIWKIFYLPSVQPDIISTKSLDFYVQPYLEKIQFDIYPESTEPLEVSIYQPDGQEVVEGPDVERKDFEKYYTLIVKDPLPGTWRYEIKKGEGKVIVYKTLLPIVMRLVSPQDLHPLGRPISVVATYQKRDGSEVKELPQYPLRFTGTLITPDNETIPFLLKKQDNRLFIWEETYSPSETGTYQIILAVQGREGFEVKSENEIKVEEIPYLVTIYPQENAILTNFSNRLNLEVMLAKKGEKTSPIGLFPDNPNALVVAEVVQRPDNDLSREKAVYLDYDSSSNLFKVALPTSLDKEGSYTVKLELEGKLADGTPIKDQIPIIFQLRLNTLDKLIGAWWFWTSIVVFILMVIGVFLFVQSNLPRLRGSLYWNGETYDLGGKRRFTIGDHKCNIDLEKPAVKGIVAWLTPRWETDEEGRKIVQVEVKYKSDISGFVTEVLEQGKIFTISTGDSFEYISDE